MQNNCTTSDRFRRVFFQRRRLLLVVNVKRKHTRCKYATLYGYETVARRAIILQAPVTVFFTTLVPSLKLIAFELAGEDRDRREKPVLSRLKIAFSALHKRG
jgi:hypothetical protein